MSSSSTTKTSYQRISSQRLHDGVLQQIARRIVRGELAPGTLLPVEAELARQFGVSRTVIREATRLLASKGLLSVRQGSGMRVRSPEEWDNLDPLVLFEQVRSGRGGQVLDEVLEVRRILEVQVAALAAERCKSEDLEALRAGLAAMAEVLGEPDEYARLDVEFHERLMMASRNRLLREALRPVHETLRQGRLLTTRLPGGPQKSLRGHEEIYAAVAAGDANGAREAMSRHVHQFETDIRAILSSMELWGPDV